MSTTDATFQESLIALFQEPQTLIEEICAKIQERPDLSNRLLSHGNAVVTGLSKSDALNISIMRLGSQKTLLIVDDFIAKSPEALKVSR